jgi:hypothetical protein
MSDKLQFVGRACEWLSYTTLKIIGYLSEDTPGDPTPLRVESDARALLFFG